MSDRLAPFPSPIREALGPVAHVSPTFQGLGSETAFITAGRGEFVLKHTHTVREGAALAAEQRVLHALSAYRPFVPEAVAFVQEGEQAWSLMTRLPGENLAEIMPATDVAGRHALATTMAWSLRRIHGWAPNLPRSQKAGSWVARAIDRAERRVRQGRIPERVQHPGDLDGLAARDLVTWLRNVEPEVTASAEMDAFLHQDPCLPNFLAADGRATGVVDWGEAGYGDRRYDLGIACWSLWFNLRDPLFQDTFLAAYGYTGDRQSLKPFEALYALQ